MLDLIEKYKELTNEAPLIDRAEKTLEDILIIVREAIGKDQENEQWFLDYLDALNEISIIY